MTSRRRRNLILFLLPIVAGCQSQILNPARIDGKYGGFRSGASPDNVDLWSGDQSSSVRDAIKTASFYPSWERAAKAAVDKNGSTEDTATSEAAAKIMLLRGIALSDRLCASWFEHLSDAQAKLSFDRDVISSSGALASAIMGASGVGAGAIAAIGATTGFSQQVVDSAASNFIITPDVGIVQQLVTELRVGLAAKLELQDSVTYSQALIQLVAYDNTCTHARVKQLVNTSVANSIKATPNQADQDRLKSVAAALSVYFVAAPTADDVTAMHTVLFPGTASPDEKAAALKKLIDDGLLKPGSTAGAPTWIFAPSYNSSTRSKAALAAITNVVQFSYPTTPSATPKSLDTHGIEAKSADIAVPRKSALSLETMTLPSIAK